MQPGNPPRHRAGAIALAGLALACALMAPTSARSALPRPGDGDLSARLAELAKPAVRSAPAARQAEELGLVPSGPGSLLRDGARVLVEVRFERGAAAGARDLRAAGAEVVNVSPTYQTVTVAARPQQLRRLASAPRVASVSEVLTPLVHAATSGPVTSATTPCFGAATSEGDSQLEASKAREEFEVDGAGVKVGVLSDSFNRDTGAETDAAADVASGDLPGPGNACGYDSAVEILDDSKKGSDEGRAMAQIVHDLAPGAELSFATAFNSLTAFADNVKVLASAGADVIVDDVSYFEEPFFQEGPVGVAVSEVSEGGASYFSSAGNNNLVKGGNDVASWETPAFRDEGECPPELVTFSEALEAEFEDPAAGLNPTHCLDFDPGLAVDTGFGVTVSGGVTLNVDLQWAEPWEGVDTDIDVFLFDMEGNLLAESFDDNPGNTQRPHEQLGWENESGESMQVQLVVNRFSGDTPRTKFALLQNGGGVTSTEYPQGEEGDVVGPTIFGHNGAADAMSVGAIFFGASEKPENFSSRGPVTHYFEPVNGITPAEPLGAPAVLAKPDITATDGGANTFFGPCSLEDAWRFFGTSAAAPHAAAVAALQRQADGGATVEQIAQAQRDSGAEIGEFPPTAVGSGLLSAVGAIEALGVSPTSPGATPAQPPAPVSCLSSEPEPEPEPEPDPEPKPEPVPPPVVPPPPPGTQPDRTAPQTFFRRKPPKVVRTRGRGRKVAFRFGSNEREAIFLCQFDRKRYRICPPRFARRFRVGRHVLRVKARDPAGNVDPKPAVYRFRVKRAGQSRGRPARRHVRRHREP